MAHATAKTAGVLGRQKARLRRDARDMSFFYVAVIAVAIAALFLFAYLWSRTTVIHIGYDISKANADRSELTGKHKRLKLEESALKSPERVERVARTELGMSYPTGSQVVRIR